MADTQDTTNATTNTGTTPTIRTFDGSPVAIIEEEDGTLRYCGRHVTDALGYSNPSKAIKDHCRGITKRYPIVDRLGHRDAADMLRGLDDDEKGTHIVRTLGGPQEMGVSAPLAAPPEQRLGGDAPRLAQPAKVGDGPVRLVVEARVDVGGAPADDAAEVALGLEPDAGLRPDCPVDGFAESADFRFHSNHDPILYAITNLRKRNSDVFPYKC